MSNIRNRPLPELADEFVLGLLDDADRDAAETLLRTSEDFRVAVAASLDRFVELDLLARPVETSPSLWDRISLGLDQSDATPEESPLSAPVAVNDNRARRWRQAALSSLAASLILAAGLTWSLTSRPDAEVIAVLLNEAGEPLVLVEDFGNASARVTPLADFDVPEGRTMQVWTLPNKEMGPVSLGLLEEVRTITLEGPALPAPHGDQLYEITLEQEGGSPTGRPTGPILVKGFAKMPR